MRPTYALMICIGMLLSCLPFALTFDIDDHFDGPSNTTTAAPDRSTTTTTVTTTKTMTTTTSPTPKPSTATPNYTVSDNSTVCMILQARVTVAFTAANKTINSTVPSSVKATGTCATAYESMQLKWNSKSNADLTLMLNVTKDGSSYKLHSVRLDYIVNGQNGSFVNDSLTQFQTSVGMYYKCMQENKIQVGDMTLVLDQLQLQAFRSKSNSTEFTGTATDCHRSKTDAVVPIAVGCALAGMVLIVLVGYCIGRRRTRAGYQAMNA